MQQQVPAAFTSKGTPVYHSEEVPLLLELLVLQQCQRQQRPNDFLFVIPSHCFATSPRGLHQKGHLSGIGAVTLTHHGNRPLGISC